ncbi:MAG: hypothetical protein S0880_21360 [Actinomycetota bacterium]|nr:hypothetical protein [Actinomycetota bacterium]
MDEAHVVPDHVAQLLIVSADQLVAYLRERGDGEAVDQAEKLRAMLTEALPCEVDEQYRRFLAGAVTADDLAATNAVLEAARTRASR